MTVPFLEKRPGHTTHPPPLSLSKPPNIPDLFNPTNLRKRKNATHRADSFQLFLDLHHFTRNLTLKRFFNIKTVKTPTNGPTSTIKEVMTPECTSPIKERIGKIKPYKVESTFYPLTAKGPFIETFHEIGLKELEQISVQNNRISNDRLPGYLNKNEKEALRSLKNNDKIVIRGADKGGGIVIQDYSTYNREALRILSDPDYYKMVKSDPFPSIQNSLEILITEAQRNKIITKKEKNFIFIPIPNKPFFYHLPKVHKCIDDPLGRPIILGINGPTSNLSHFIDLYFQEYVGELKSYLKDSDGLIKILKTLEWNEDIKFLTMDVTSLYSKINHENGIQCVERYLQQDAEVPECQRTFLLDGLSLILHNYFFEYNGAIYHQRRGTAMGTRVAPAYANLFMGCSEETFIYSTNKYSDNIFLYNEREAPEFTNYLNKNTWGISFTPKYNTTEIDFLDLLITHDESRFITSTYFKQVDSNSYLEFSSGHHDAWKRNVPFGQFRLVLKNCTEETTFEIKAEKIKQRFQDKGYPKGLIKNAFNRAKKTKPGHMPDPQTP